MRRGQLRSGVAGAVLATVIFAAPAFAFDDIASKGQRGGWFSWVLEGWTRLVSITLAAGMHADPNGGEQVTVPDPGAGSPAASGSSESNGR